MRRYTWKPDLPDFRDHPFERPMGVLPSHVDLRPICSPIEDQGNLGSCVAQAVVGALEYLDKRDDGHYRNLSRLMLYREARKIDGVLNEDSGTSIRAGVKAAAKVGTCLERLWPYRIAKFRDPPSKAAYGDAENHRIKEYQRLRSLDDLRAALASGLPVAFGMTVYESFESAKVEQTGVVPMPKDSEQILGGHAILAVGYDDPTRRLICRNSWGARWGMAGNFTLPYAYVDSRDLSDDYWVVRR